MFLPFFYCLLLTCVFFTYFYNGQNYIEAPWKLIGKNFQMKLVFYFFIFIFIIAKKKKKG